MNICGPKQARLYQRATSRSQWMGAAGSLVLAAALAVGGCSSDDNVSTAAPSASSQSVFSPYAKPLEDVVEQKVDQPMPAGCDVNGAVPGLRPVVAGADGALSVSVKGMPLGALVRDMAGSKDRTVLLIDRRGPDAVVSTDGTVLFELDGEGVAIGRTDDGIDVSVEVAPAKYSVERYTDVSGSWKLASTAQLPDGTAGPALLMTGVGKDLFAVVVEKVEGDGQQQSNLYRLGGDGTWTPVTEFRSDGDKWVTVSSVETATTEGATDGKDPALLLTVQRGNAQGHRDELSAQPVLVDITTAKVIASGVALQGDPQFVDRRSDRTVVIEIPMQDGGVRVASDKPDTVLGCGRSGSRALGLGNDPDSTGEGT